jgi:dTDP-4-dehydrorhamnose reductase
MRMRILILGTTGQLGWELNRTAACLGDIITFDYPQVDFTKPDQLDPLVHQTKTSFDHQCGRVHCSGPGGN